MFQIEFQSPNKKPSGSGLGRFVRGVLGLMVLATLLFFSLTFVFVVVCVALVAALVFVLYARLRYGKNFVQRWQMEQLAKRAKARAPFGYDPNQQFSTDHVDDLGDIHVKSTNRRRGVVIDGEVIEVVGNPTKSDKPSD
jgi:hypothetical protein